MKYSTEEIEKGRKRIYGLFSDKEALQTWVKAFRAKLA